MSLINCSYLMSCVKYCYKCPLKPVAKFRIGFWVWRYHMREFVTVLFVSAQEDNHDNELLKFEGDVYKIDA